jgi:hypothetical protein
MSYVNEIWWHIGYPYLFNGKVKKVTGKSVKRKKVLASCFGLQFYRRRKGAKGCLVLFLLVFVVVFLYRKTVHTGVIKR